MNTTFKSNKVLSAYRGLLFRYLSVYSLATMSDWLQGPFVYAIYSSYGFSQHEIALLYVMGCASSMVFGSFIGGMADKGGRKKYVIIFSVVYGTSCFTKHFNHFGILMLSALLSGISSSLLHSVFDSWLIKAHKVENIDKSYIPLSFSIASYWNSIVAIFAGLLSNKISTINQMRQLKAVNKNTLIYAGGYLNTYDISLTVLVLCGILAGMTWKENYGEYDGQNDLHSNMKKKHTPFQNIFDAVTTIHRNKDIMICGLISSLFEGSMYVFVFMWTPMLSSFVVTHPGKDDNDEKSTIIIPHGLVFSTFMVCCMIGSSFTIFLIDRIRCERLAIYVLILSSLIMAWIHRSKNDIECFFAMNLFEICVGMYFPMMKTMKSAIVPENLRSAIYNVYRIPLNIIVLASLLSKLSVQQSFLLNTWMLGLASIMQIKLMRSRVAKAPRSMVTMSI